MVSHLDLAVDVKGVKELVQVGELFFSSETLLNWDVNLAYPAALPVQSIWNIVKSVVSEIRVGFGR